MTSPVANQADQLAKPARPTTSSLAQLGTLTRYNLLALRRNPAASFFTVVLPLLFLLIFTAIFGNEMIRIDGDDEPVRLATFYVPGILALALVSATTVNLAIANVYRRENGLLKRLRGSPLRPSTYVIGELVAGLLIVLFMSVLLISVGWIVYDVSLRLAAMPVLLLTVLIAAPAFSALALAMSTIIGSETAAPAVTNMFVLPLYFVSDVFFQTTEDSPAVVTFIGDVFPIKHVAHALGEGFNPTVTGVTWPWQDLLVIAAWGAFGALVALRRFQWVPRKR